MNDPTCQRQVGSPWEGDFGLFYQGSAERGRLVAKFFSHRVDFDLGRRKWPEILSILWAAQKE